MRIIMNGTYKFTPSTDSPLAAAWAGTHTMKDFTFDYDLADLAAFAEAIGASADDILFDFRETNEDEPIMADGTHQGDESHPCERDGCQFKATYDDEPYCYTHTPNNGGDFPNYSWKRQQAENRETAGR